MNKIVTQSKQTFFVLVALSFLVGSCKYIPANRFAFSPTPQNGNSGGISGVFVHEIFESCGEYAYLYEIFQFYDDGTVLDVSTCSDGDIISDWADIKKWFNRDNDEIAISRGEYFISHDHIWFTTTVYSDYDKELIIVDYSGTNSDDKVILNVYSHYNGHEENDREYLRIDVEQ